MTTVTANCARIRGRSARRSRRRRRDRERPHAGRARSSPRAARDLQRRRPAGSERRPRGVRSGLTKCTSRLGCAHLIRRRGPQATAVAGSIGGNTRTVRSSFSRCWSGSPLSRGTRRRCCVGETCSTPRCGRALPFSSLSHRPTLASSRDTSGRSFATRDGMSSRPEASAWSCSSSLSLFSSCPCRAASSCHRGRARLADAQRLS
jgi:hypothetical protein